MKITEKVHLLKILFKIPIAPDKHIDRFVNVFIIAGEKIHLIDSGVKGSHDFIFDYLGKIGRDENEIASLILTHSHPDHIGAAKSIKENTNCRIFANPIEAGWIQDVNKQFAERPVPGFFDLVEGSVKIDQFVTNDENIQLERDINVRTIFTPGHSPGSTCYHYIEEKVLFSGDAVLLPGEMPILTNYSDYLKSIEKIQSLHNFEILFSAWDEPRYGDKIISVIENSSNYVQLIRKTVRDIVTESTNISSIDFCKSVLEKLKMPTGIANPLLLKSFQAVLE